MRWHYAKIWRNSAFSLIEILVAVAIITLLVSALVPAILKARRTAQRVVCISNLRQLYNGMSYYTDEHGETFIPSSSFSFDAILPYLENAKEITRCPVIQGYYDAGIISYGYNELVAGKKYSQISSSLSETILFCDSGYPLVVYKGEPAVTRHGAVGYAAYLDGHVAFIDTRYLWTGSGPHNQGDEVSPSGP